MSTFTSHPEVRKNWIRTHLSALYSSPDEASFETAFEHTYAPSPHFQGASVNGEQEDRDKHKEALRGVRASCAKPAEVQFGDVEEVDNDGQSSTMKGEFTVHRMLKIRIRAALAQRERKIAFTAKLKEDPAFASTDSSEGSLRIIEYTETFEDKQTPISLHPSGGTH